MGDPRAGRRVVLASSGFDMGDNFVESGFEASSGNHGFHIVGHGSKLDHRLGSP